jgi:predicted nucleic acid-binding protein
MIIDRTTQIFFDASCLIAAAGSPHGGSGFLLSLCARQFLRGAVSQLVLLEAERNLQAKLGQPVLYQLHHLLQTTPFEVAAVPIVSPLAEWRQSINAKDTHVIAAALTAKVSFLLTLDQRLIAEVNQASLPLQALVPGTFIKDMLPFHAEYPSLRS